MRSLGRIVWSLGRLEYITGWFHKETVELYADRKHLVGNLFWRLR